MRLLALDVDRTLAEANRPVAPSTIDLLRRIQDRGVRLMLVSGKPAAYLAGFARQLGIGELVISGEDGMVTLSSQTYPPSWEHVAAVPADTPPLLERFAREVTGRFGDRVWLQPNVVNVSVFWGSAADAADVLAFARGFAESETARGLRVYEHADAVEVTAAGVDKGVSLRVAMAKLGLSPSDVVAVGDSSNDLPMFEVAGSSVGIAFAAADRTFDDIDSALTWLLEREGNA